jgi:hypothetical protein
MSPTDPTPTSKLKDARTSDGEVPEPPEGHKHHPHAVVQRGQVSHMEEHGEQPEPMPVDQKETLHSTKPSSSDQADGKT